jgi:hypothetical protein
MASNRLRLVNWRKHGGDESHVYFAVYGADDSTEPEDEIREELGMDPDPDRTAEEHGAFDHVLYINDDLTVEDGQVFSDHRGRKFRVTITEIGE